MSITLEREESRWRIRLGGQINLTSAAELKDRLLEWLAAGKDADLELDGLEEIDVSALQLLWAAAREAGFTGAQLTGWASPAAAAAIEDSGFAGAPGFPRFRVRDE